MREQKKARPTGGTEGRGKGNGVSYAGGHHFLGQAYHKRWQCARRVIDWTC